MGELRLLLGQLALRGLARRGTLTVLDPATAERQLVLLATAEAHVRSLHGIDPLDDREISNVARDTASPYRSCTPPKSGASP
ncbi:MAG: TetR/AcrR family transcriptional regulator C-terminal domain-containing protein [Streptosporangiaceae bacterium]